MELVFKVKVDGKFQTVARFGNNKFGNKQFSLNKSLLKTLLASEGNWLDLSVFENEEKKSDPLPDDANLDF